LAEKLKLVEEENEKLEAKINGLKQEYEKIGLQVTKVTTGNLTQPNLT
jgi:hypothetical protein